jgi:hypothetical protein
MPVSLNENRLSGNPFGQGCRTDQLSVMAMTRFVPHRLPGGIVEGPIGHE